MKIGINASFLRKPYSGTGQVTHLFLDELIRKTPSAEEGKKNKIILYLEEDTDLDLPSNFEKRVFLPPYRRDDLIRKVWWEKFLLPKKVKQDGCDIFFSLYQTPTILKSCRHLMLIHDTVPKIFPKYLDNSRRKIYQKLIDRAVPRADHIVTISENSKKDIQKFYGIAEDKITVNLIGCDPIFEREFSKDEINKVLKKFSLENEKFMLYFGGFDARKNVAGLIDSYGRFFQKAKKHSGGEIPNLVILGKFHPHLVPLMTDIPKEIRRSSEKYNLPLGKIKLIDAAVPHEELAAFYARALFFCFPSRYEGFGVPPLEAMKVGCSVITSKTSSLPEVTGPEAALLVDPENHEEIANAIWKLFENEELRINFAKKGRERAKLFTWEKFLAKWTELVFSL